jgi:hypothetical protein
MAHELVRIVGSLSPPPCNSTLELLTIHRSDPEVGVLERICWGTDA